MRADGLRSLSLALGALLALGAAPPPKMGASRPNQGAPATRLPKVVLEDLVDDRYAGGAQTSGLIAVLKLEGKGADDYPAGRAFVKEARDDTGRSLLPEKRSTPRFRKLNGGSGLRVDLVAPPRSARTVSLSGTVELFVPKKDPACVVKVPNALAKLDVPLVSPGLAAAKMQVTPLSKARYAEEVEKQRSPEAAARLRQLLKADGMTDREISRILEMSDESDKPSDSSGSGHVVVLMVKNQDFERIQDVRLIGRDGQELLGDWSTDSDGINVTRCWELKNEPDPQTVIVFTLYTDKARSTVPFALKDVVLP